MATLKVTVTLPEERVEEIRALIAAGQVDNVSGFVRHAVALALNDAAGWREMLGRALDQTGGPVTEEERAWAEGFLKPRRTKKASRKG